MEKWQRVAWVLLVVALVIACATKSAFADTETVVQVTTYENGERIVLEHATFDNDKRAALFAAEEIRAYAGQGFDLPVLVGHSGVINEFGHAVEDYFGLKGASLCCGEHDENTNFWVYYDNDLDSSVFEIEIPNA